MSSLEPLGIALLSAIAFAPSALAQDAAGADTTTTDTAAVTTTDDNGTVSGKRIAIVGGGAILKPDSDPATGLDIDGGTAPTLSASWYLNDNMAIELWGAADKFNHRVRGPEGKIGTVEQQPIALSGQYHFRAADGCDRLRGQQQFGIAQGAVITVLLLLLHAFAGDDAGMGLHTQQVLVQRLVAHPFSCGIGGGVGV